MPESHQLLRHILQRLIMLGPLLLGVSMVSFFIMSLAPGEPFSELTLSPEVSGQTVADMRAQYGLDLPIWRQYVSWLTRAGQGDLGISVTYGIPIMTLICARAGNTLALAGVSLLLAWCIAIPLSIITAVRQHSVTDRVISMGCYATGSVPAYFLALCLLFLVVRLRLPLPIGGATSIDYTWLSFSGKIVDRVMHLLVPAFVLAVVQASSLIRYMRSSLLDVLKQEYITTARGKGLNEKQVILRHACRNAANPVITLLGLEIGGLLSGAALTEAVTGWPGLGTLILSAVNARDHQLVLGSLLASSALLVLGNLVADVLLTLTNPRLVR